MREWQCVTVALAASSSWASGLPTRIERPITTALRALELDVGLAQQLHHAGRRAGHHAPRSRSCMSSPALAGVRPSTSLRGVDQRDELVLVEVVGQRQLEQDAVHARVGVELAEQAGQLVRLDVAAGSSW